MTRPKVPADQRQRTAQACESCKRRKQKCNGLCPCNTCEKRKFTCLYADRDAPSPGEDGRPIKKRALPNGDGEQDSLAATETSTPTSGIPAHSPLSLQPNVPSLQHQPSSFTAVELQPRSDPLSVKHEENPFRPPDERPTVEAAARSLQQFASGQPTEEQPTFRSRGSTQSGQDEEAVVYTQSRMLQDPTGRLLYVGDSATLSFLQLLRMMVENVAGASLFTNDPRRHKIVEGQFSLPPGARHTHLLPDKRTAHVLVDAFFINTHGLLHIYERQKFFEDLERCYSDPLSTESYWLCTLNLVFAIGLTLATPLSGSTEALIVEKLRSEHLDRAEVFYLNAKSLNDPMIGLEDQDFWSVQALLLKSVYMLAKSKRNSAFATLGMAARSAYALGLHREETMVIFSPEEQAARKNLWRSLFVIDRLLSCSLGRPTAISEDDCSGDTLRPADPPANGENFAFKNGQQADFNETGAYALEAAVRSCSVIGTILKKVYQTRKISTRLAQEIADVCKAWPRALPPLLHWRQASSASPSQGVAILHVNLFYCHSIILLTRPFFLYLLSIETQRQAAGGHRGARPFSRMEKFSEACVIASTHTILLVQNAFEAGHLSRRNPAVIYFLFAAALIIQANEFAGLYKVDSADTCITNSINLMSYCAESDQQASRLVYILSTFRDVVSNQRARLKQSQPELVNLPSISSQLYGVPLQPQQQGPSNAATDVEQTLNTSRLHQVPIHIYPGMQTGPLPPEQQPLSPSQSQHPATLPQPNISPTPISTTLPQLSSPLAFNLAPPLSKPPSLSNVLDLSALDARAPSLYSEDGSGADEHIDFDALWAWPSTAVGSPRVGEGMGLDRVQGVSDSAVPLFGVVGGGE